MRRGERDLQERLGDRVRFLRLSLDLTQDDLASRCGMSQKYLSELERGVKAPSFETLIALAHDGFGIRLAALLYSVDEGADADLRRLDQLLAGRPEAARRRVLRAVAMLLEAGEESV